MALARAGCFNKNRSPSTVAADFLRFDLAPFFGFALSLGQRQSWGMRQVSVELPIPGGCQPNTMRVGGILACSISLAMGYDAPDPIKL